MDGSTDGRGMRPLPEVETKELRDEIERLRADFERHLREDCLPLFARVDELDRHFTALSAAWRELLTNEDENRNRHAVRAVLRRLRAGG